MKLSLTDIWWPLKGANVNVKPGIQNVTLIIWDWEQSRNGKSQCKDLNISFYIDL